MSKSSQSSVDRNWHNLPFYAQDKFSDLICIETQETLEDKIFAISCMFDTMKGIPQLLEIGLLEDTLAERVVEMSKLYILFAQEQFVQFAEEIQSKGDLC